MVISKNYIQLIERLTVGLSLLVLASLFGWIFYENFLFSSFDVLHIKAMEEIYYQDSVYDLYHYWEEGDWKSAFAMIEMAYGNLFWHFIAVCTFPFIYFNQEAAVIVIPRQISLVCYMATFYVFYLIAKARHYPKTETILLMVLIISSSMGLFTANFFHNTMPLALMVVYSCYLLIRSEQKKYHYWAAIIFGLALGVKATIVFFLPIIFILLNKENISSWRKISLWGVLKQNTLYMGIVGFSALVGNSPLILWFPFDPGRALDGMEELYLTLSHKTQVAHPPAASLERLYSNLEHSFFALNYQWPVFLLALIAAIIVLWKAQSTVAKAVAYMTLAGLAVIVFVCGQLEFGHVSVSTYTLSFIFLLPLIFLELSLYRRLWARGVIVVLLASNWWMNKDIINDYIFDTYRRYHSAEFAAQLKQYEIFEKVILLEERERIFQSYLVVFPYNKIESNGGVDFYTTALFPDHVNYSLFVFDKKSPLYVSPCPEIAEPALLPPDLCLRIKKVIAVEPPYIELYSNENVLVIRNPEFDPSVRVK